jgi:hypothetical protein
MPTIEELRAAMRSAVLTGKGNYLPLGMHDVQITKFFFKSPGTNSPMGLFLAEFTVSKSTDPNVTIGGTYSEGFDPAKVGWMERMKKFLLATLGMDWRGTIPVEVHDLCADIRFSEEFPQTELAPAIKKYGHKPADFLVGRSVRAEGTPYTTKTHKEIVSVRWIPTLLAS